MALLRTVGIIVAVGAVFVLLGTAIWNSGGDPTAGMGTKAAGFLLLALSIAIVWGAVAITRHRRRIASKAANLSLDAMAGGVRASRFVKRKAGELRDSVKDRADDAS